MKFLFIVKRLIIKIIRSPYFKTLSLLKYYFYVLTYCQSPKSQNHHRSQGPPMKGYLL